MSDTNRIPPASDEQIAVATTSRYNSRGAVWAVAKVGPFPTKAEARETAEQMLQARPAAAADSEAA